MRTHEINIQLIFGPFCVSSYFFFFFFFLFASSLSLSLVFAEQKQMTRNAMLTSRPSNACRRMSSHAYRTFFFLRLFPGDKFSVGHSIGKLWNAPQKCVSNRRWRPASVKLSCKNTFRSLLLACVLRDYRQIHFIPYFYPFNIYIHIYWTPSSQQ